MGRTDAICSPFWLHKGEKKKATWDGQLARMRRELPAGSRQVSGVKAFEVDVKATYPGNAAERSSASSMQTLH